MAFVLTTMTWAWVTPEACAGNPHETHADDPRDARAEDSGAAPAALDPAPKQEPTALRLDGNSTLADWRRATTAERSRIAVALARSSLALDATRLEIATAAMEITGCLSRTASDPKFDAWRVATTAGTCLNAPEKPAP